MLKKIFHNLTNIEENHLKFDKKFDKYQVMAWKQLAETLVVLFSRTQLPALHLVEAVQLRHKWSRLKIALFSN